MKVILHHPAFYPNLDAPDMVKPPIVFVAAGLRKTRRFIKSNSWSWLLDGMGQVPFYPPNVSGWKQGPAFLNTNTARAYWQATDYLLYQTVNDPGTQTPQAGGHRRRRRRSSHPWASSDTPRQARRPTPPTTPPATGRRWTRTTASSARR